MNIEELKAFLIDFSTNGYASTEGIVNPNGSKTILYPNKGAQWEANDTYWGGEPFSGDAVVSLDGRPSWTVLYRGKVYPSVEDLGMVYGFLRKALANTDPEFPVRGPVEFVEGNLKYENHWHGNLEEFEGKERILNDGKEIYLTRYMGGVINQRDE